MVDSTLLLVGTIHNDPSGPERLRKILEKNRPARIALEFHAERFKSLKEKAGAGIRAAAIVEAAAELSLTTSQRAVLREHTLSLESVYGFEKPICDAYSIRTAVPVHWIDIAVHHGEYEIIAGGRYKNFQAGIQEIYEDLGKREALLKEIARGAEMLTASYQFTIDELYEDYEGFAEMRRSIAERLGKSNIRAWIRKDFGEAFLHSLTLENSEEREDALANNIKIVSQQGRIRTVAICGAAHLVGLRDRLEAFGPEVMTLADADYL